MMHNAPQAPYVRSYIIGAGDFNVNISQKKVAAWVQDDWKRMDRLTLNLGVRYDLTTNAFANNISFPPFQSAGRPSEYTNVQPRVGFAYKLNTWTVLRGEAGLYYGDTLGDSATAVGNAQVAQFQYLAERIIRA
jgi:outer membrane receptor protein involved in Fe transport